MVELQVLGADDIGCVAELVRTCGLDAWIDEAALRRHMLADLSSPPDMRLLAVQGGEPCGFCSAALRDGQAYVQLFGVAPPFRRQGIGSQLLGEIEARALARGIQRVQVAGVSGGYFYPGVPVDATPAICLLERRGYRTDRTSRVDMDVDLTAVDLDTRDAVEELGAQGISVRRVASGEVSQVVHFAEQYFSRTWGLEAAAADGDEPTLYAAWYQGEVVSFAVYDALGHARFGPTGTRPDMRQRGIGGVLLKRCMETMRDRGDRHAQIIWVGPIGFYARAVGARVSRAYWGFAKDLA
ncbi:MAG: GNAT family N-acetyltransferase [Anaerolineae bacterium]|jgi:GNAT superfamily N-acetyltransferase